MEKYPKKNDETNYPFGRFFHTMNRLFSEHPSKNLLESMDQFFTASKPFGGFPVTLKENDHNYLIEAQLPDVSKDQIDIEILPNYCLITVRHMESMTKKNSLENSFEQKFLSNEESRTVPLSKPINAKRAKAEHKNDVLSITIPKAKGKKINLE